MQTADAIANFFLDKAEACGRHDMTPMKLQKLVYFAQGWHLALRGEPLINERLQVWQYGPVIPSLYHEFKEFGSRPVTRRAADLVFVPDGTVQKQEAELVDADQWLYDLLGRVWEVYGDYTPIQLSNLTHEPGTPWRTLYDQFNGKIPPGLHLPDEMIKAYLKGQLSPPAAS